MYADEDFYEVQPCTSRITLSHNNNKSSVLCPETQNITSQYLALQQLDAHQKMISRAKGVVDTSAPKSMQSYISVTSQRKKKMLQNLKNDSSSHFLADHSEDPNQANSSRLSALNSEEEIESTNTSFVNKAIQAGIPVSNYTSKTAEKISWYLEALSLGELQSQFFTFHENCSGATKSHEKRNMSRLKARKKFKGDILEHHKKCFIPRKPFSPKILADQKAESRIKKMDCYNPPVRKKKTSSIHSYDTFESYEEDDELDEHLCKKSENTDVSDHSTVEETLINRKPENHTYCNHATPLLPQHKKNYIYSSASDILNQNEEDKYLDFLSKVTEDILRSGVYTDRAIQKAFEFHMQFYKDESNKEKLESLMNQVLQGLKISNDDDNNEVNFQHSSSVFPLSISNTPPEKETSGLFLQNGVLKLGSECDSNETKDSAENTNSSNS